MNFLNTILIKYFTKELTEIASKNKEVLIQFPGKYSVRRGKKLIQIFNPRDKHFLLQFSIMNNRNGDIFNINSGLEMEKKKNPNAEIRSIGKYDCIYSKTRTKDNAELIYSWIIGHSTKLIISTLLIGNLT